MLLLETEVQAPYRSVRHALRSSFELEGHDICKSPTLLGSRMSMQTDLTPFDRAAQAAIIINLLHHNCRLQVIQAVTALYMPLEGRAARGVLISKANAIHSMAWHVRSYPHLQGYPFEYLRDVVCTWADAPQLMLKNEVDWLDELGKSSRHLQRIKFGNVERGRPGVCQLLDDLLDEGCYTMGDVLRSRGIVGRWE